MLFDFSMTAAPADRPDEVRAKEPRLSGKGFGSVNRAYEQFFASTLRRYCEGLQKTSFTSVLDNTSTCIPGSYTIERRATITTLYRSEREFTVMLHKRYDLNKLIDRMRQEGWGPINGWPFGKNKERMLYLFERLPSSAAR